MYWTRFEQEGWCFYIAATDKGLSYVGSHDQPFSELAGWAAKHHPGTTLLQSEERMEGYVTEIREYLDGERQSFSFSFDMTGTPFQQEVWQALQSIPFGETRSYSELAEAIGRPSAVRAIASAIGANPVLITIPCHRVIGKNGSLTGYRGGLAMKTRLLELERKREE